MNAICVKMFCSLMGGSGLDQHACMLALMLYLCLLIQGSLAQPAQPRLPVFYAGAPFSSNMLHACL